MPETITYDSLHYCAPFVPVEIDRKETTMKSFKAMAEVIKTLPANTQKEILDALDEDFNDLTGLIEQSRMNSQGYSDKVGAAVEYANKRKDPLAKHFTRWNMQDSYYKGAYQTQMDMQCVIRNMVVECQQALNNAKDGE